jgi:hypothetical protein
VGRKERKIRTLKTLRKPQGEPQGAAPKPKTHPQENEEKLD